MSSPAAAGTWRARPSSASGRASRTSARWSRSPASADTAASSWPGTPPAPTRCSTTRLASVIDASADSYCLRRGGRGEANRRARASTPRGRRRADCQPRSPRSGAAGLGLLERPALHQPLPARRTRGRLPVLSAGRPVDGLPIGATAHGRARRESRRVSRPPAAGPDRRLSAERVARPLVHRCRRARGTPRLSEPRARAGGSHRPLDRCSARRNEDRATADLSTLTRPAGRRDLTRAVAVVGIRRSSAGTPACCRRGRYTASGRARPVGCSRRT